MEQSSDIMPTYTAEDVFTYLGIFLLNRDYAGIILICDLVGEEKDLYFCQDMKDINKAFSIARAMLKGHL